MTDTLTLNCRGTAEMVPLDLLLTLHGLVRQATRPAALGGTPLSREEALSIYADSQRVLLQAARVADASYAPTPTHLLTALEDEPHAWGGAPE